MSSEIDAVGGDLPDFIDRADTDGPVDADLVYAVRSRAFTQANREFYDPEFGFQAYLLDAGLLRRQNRSLSRIPGWDYATRSVASDGRRLRVRVLMTPED